MTNEILPKVVIRTTYEYRTLREISMQAVRTKCRLFNRRFA